MNNFFLFCNNKSRHKIKGGRLLSLHKVIRLEDFLNVLLHRLNGFFRLALFLLFHQSASFFIAILNFALRERGLRSISSSDGAITFFMSKGDVVFPKKSFSILPSMFPLLMKFFTILSSREW